MIGSKWRKHRKILTPAFHFRILDKFVPVFEKNARILIEKLGGMVGKEFDIMPTISLCSLDIISETAMGLEVNAQKKESKYVKAVNELLEIIAHRNFDVIQRSFIFDFLPEGRRHNKLIKYLHSVTESHHDPVSVSFRGAAPDGYTISQVAFKESVMGPKTEPCGTPLLTGSGVECHQLSCMVGYESVNDIDCWFAGNLIGADHINGSCSVRVLLQTAHIQVPGYINNSRVLVLLSVAQSAAQGQCSSSSMVMKERKAKLQETNEENGEEINEDIGIRKKKAFLDLLLEYNKEGAGMTDAEIRDEVDTFMFEGYDTTSSTLSFCLYCLSQNQDVQDKAIDELNQVYGGSDRESTYQDFQEMKYLEKVIKETLRLYPTVQFIARYTNQDLDLKILGWLNIFLIVTDGAIQVGTLLLGIKQYFTTISMNRYHFRGAAHKELEENL
ncbi:hypothetical protein J6590_044050 [Homalodisca vitripennis]|nr:hypothetical protein J6590_044050 [Homalodisca vitripennis]